MRYTAVLSQLYGKNNQRQHQAHFQSNILSKMILSNNTSFPQEMNGSSTNASSQCFVHDSNAVKTLRVTGYSVLILLSLLGNSLVVAVVCRYKAMRKTTNIFIANMAVADLIITTVYMPRLIAMFVIGITWIEGTVGLVLCKIIPFLHGVALLVSILTLLLISVERLCAILFPLKYIFTSKMTKIAVAAIWMVALLARMPYFLALRLAVYPSGRIACGARLDRFFGKTEARDIYYSTLLGAFYALPLALIIVSYLVIIIYLRKLRETRSRLAPNLLDEHQAKIIRKVVKMMMVVTVAFIACWITYFVAQLVFNKVPCALRFWRVFLAHSNSALNPCLYVCFNRKFRRGFVKIIVGIFTCDKETPAERRERKYRVHSSKQGEVKMEMVDVRAEDPNGQV